MTQDQYIRGVSHLVVGVTLAVFALATFVRAWRTGEHPIQIGWPFGWNALLGFFLWSISAVFLVEALRAFAGWTTQTEHRLLYASLGYCMVMSLWTFFRWSRDDEAPIILPPCGSSSDSYAFITESTTVVSESTEGTVSIEAAN